MSNELEKVCPYCAETVKAAAIRCKHCQADLILSAERKVGNTEHRYAQSLPNPGIAAILSFIIPGSGFVYTGNFGGAIVLFCIAAVTDGLFFFGFPWLQIMLHFIWSMVTYKSTLVRNMEALGIAVPVKLRKIKSSKPGNLSKPEATSTGLFVRELTMTESIVAVAVATSVIGGVIWWITR